MASTHRAGDGHPVAADLRQLRDAVLGGRGPGAGTSEVLQHTRARLRVGGEPVPGLRAEVAHAAAVTRGDTEALAVEVAADRDRLSGTLGALRGRVPATGVGAPARARRRWWQGRRRDD